MLWGTVSVNSFLSRRVMSFVKGFNDTFSHCLNATATPYGSLFCSIQFFPVV